MTISNVGGVRADISDMLSKIREVSNKTPALSTVTQAQPTSNFGDVMSLAKTALTHVTQLQTQSEAVKNAYIAGDSSVSMSQVVVASQKSKLAFEGLVTVRNKILEAYKEIMNMPV
jgi:flagellar hook-basal body complex protein FliE